MVVARYAIWCSIWSVLSLSFSFLDCRLLNMVNKYNPCICPQTTVEHWWTRSTAVVRDGISPVTQFLCVFLVVLTAKVKIHYLLFSSLQVSLIDRFLRWLLLFPCARYAVWCSRLDLRRRSFNFFNCRLMNVVNNCNPVCVLNLKLDVVVDSCGLGYCLRLGCFGGWDDHSCHLLFYYLTWLAGFSAGFCCCLGCLPI